MWIASSFLFASQSFFSAVAADWQSEGSDNAETTKERAVRSKFGSSARFDGGVCRDWMANHEE